MPKQRPKTPPNVRRRYKAGLYTPLLEQARRVLDKANVKHNIPRALPGAKKDEA